MKAPITTAQAMNHPDVVLTINTLGKMADELRAEIDELRVALASAGSLQIATYTQVVVLDKKLQERDAKVPPAVLMNQLINDKLELSIKLAKQRKVLEQAGLLHLLESDHEEKS